MQPFACAHANTITASVRPPHAISHGAVKAMALRELRLIRLDLIAMSPTPSPISIAATKAASAIIVGAWGAWRGGLAYLRP